MKLFLPILFLLFSLSGCCQTLIYPAAPNSSKPNTKQFAPAGLLCHIHPAAPFDPRTGGTLFAWYDVTDASNTVVNGSTKVSNLKDKSGNGYNLSNCNNGVSYPPYHATGGANNLPYMNFVNGGGMDLFPASTNTLPATCTMYYVMRNDAFVNNTFVLGLSNGNNTFVQQVSQPAGLSLTMNNGSQYNRNNNGYNGTNWQILCMNWGTPNGGRMSTNNEPYTESGFTYNAGGSGTSGANYIEFGPYYRNGSFSVHELLIYSGAVSYTNDSLIRNYLMNKYNPPKYKTVLYLGNSIEWGAAENVDGGNPDSSSYAALICRDSAWHIVQYAYPGSAASAAGTGSVNAPGHNGSDIYPHALAEKVDWSNTFVIIGFGTNDRNNGMFTAPYLQPYKDTMNAMIQGFLGYGVPSNHIIVESQPARYTGGTAAFSSGHTLDSNMYYLTKGIAVANGVTFYDDYTVNASTSSGTIATYIYSDGIHLTSAGHRALATHIEQILPGINRYIFIILLCLIPGWKKRTINMITQKMAA